VPKSGEFYTFDEVLKHLNINANKLKRLVSEGEIRAFREGDEMKFKRGDIDHLDLTGGDETTALDFAEAEAESSETLTDDLIFDEGDELELDTDEAGMATAEITSEDTFVDEEPIGMSTEPLDFSADEVEEDIEEIEEIPMGGARRPAAGSRPAARARYAEAEVSESIVWPIVLVLSGLLLLLGGFVVVSLIQGEPNDLTQGLGRWFAENFGNLGK
jgi:excisionase family DNA binding protein